MEAMKMDKIRIKQEGQKRNLESPFGVSYWAPWKRWPSRSCLRNEEIYGERKRREEEEKEKKRRRKERVISKERQG